MSSTDPHAVQQLGAHGPQLLAPSAAPGPRHGPPRPHPQLLRGAQHRWWRPLLSLAVLLGGAALATGLLVVAFVVAVLLDDGVGAADLTDPSGVGELLTTWWVFLLQNLYLACGIPLAGLAVWVGHGWRPGWVSSVVGRVRWRWLAVAALASLVVTAVSVGLSLLAGGDLAWAPEPQAALLIVVVLLTTPLQAAGEEYAFRGWLSQAVGSWFARPVVAALVAGAVSATLFAVAHGTQGPWLFADRFAFGVVASILVWRTGGLEAAVALHALNNMVIFVPTVLSGGLAEAFETTDLPWQSFVLDVLAMSVAVVVLDRLARRRGLQRTQTALLPPARGARPLQGAPAVR